jgi:hypothetical protein
MKKTIVMPLERGVKSMSVCEGDSPIEKETKRKDEQVAPQVGDIVLEVGVNVISARDDGRSRA